MYRNKDQFCKVNLYFKYGNHEIDLTREKDYNQFFCNHAGDDDEEGTSNNSESLDKTVKSKKEEASQPDPTLTALLSVKNSITNITKNLIDQTEKYSTKSSSNTKSQPNTKKDHTRRRRQESSDHKRHEHYSSSKTSLSNASLSNDQAEKYKCILPWFNIPITVIPQCHRYNFINNIWMIIFCSLLPLPILTINGLVLRMINYLFLRKVQKQNIYVYMNIKKDEPEKLMIDPPGGYKSGSFPDNAENRVEEEFPSLGKLYTYWEFFCG